MIFRISHSRKSGLSALAMRYIERLPSLPPADWSAVCAALDARPFAHHNLSLEAATPGEAAALLSQHLTGAVNTALHCEQQETSDRGVVFVYSGQGGQWSGMGRELYHAEPVFRRSLEEISCAAEPYAGFSVRGALLGLTAESELQSIDVVQPVVFAFQVALTKLLQSWGLAPTVFVGHSSGEVAAAHCAGGVSLQEAAQIICTRSRLMRTIEGRGQMLFVAVGADEAQRLAARCSAVSVAALNGPSASVLSGDATAIYALHAELQREAKVFSRVVKVGMASHSSQVEAIAQPLLDDLASLSPHPSWTADFYSTVTGTCMTGQQLGPNHWWQGLRQSVLFYPVVRELLASGYRHFVEVGPHPVLASNIAESELADPTSVAVLPAQERGCDSLRWLQNMMVRLHARGVVRRASVSERAVSMPLPAADDAETEALELQLTASGYQTSRAPAAPAQQATHVRHVLRELIAALVSCEPANLDPNATLIQLGADSLKTLLLCKQLKTKLGASFALSEVLQSSLDSLERSLVCRSAATASDQSSQDAAQFTSDQDLEAFAVLPANEARSSDATSTFPLTPLQQAYWLGQQTKAPLSGPAHLYFERDAWDLDIERFARALDCLIERHDVLRSCVTSDGVWKTLAQPSTQALCREDLRDLTPTAQHEHLATLRTDMQSHSPSAAACPGLRVHALRLNERHTRLMFASNLLIIDYTSWRVLEHEWQQLYDQPERELPVLALGYAEYVRAASGFSDSPTYKRASEYWNKRVSTLPAGPTLPCAPEVPVEPEWRSHVIRLRAEVWSALKRRAAAVGVTEAMLLCGVYAEVLGHWSQSQHFTLNLLSQNRLPVHPQVGELVARFSSTLLLEVDQRADHTFSERLLQLQEQFLRDYEQRYVCGVEVARRYNQLHRSGGTASFPVVFASVLGTRGSGSVPMAWSGDLVERCLRTPQVLLDNQVYEESGELVVAWDYIHNGFRSGVIEAMLCAYEGLLNDLAADAALWSEERPLARRARSSRQQSSRLASPERCIHSDFCAQAKRTPHSPAVITDTLTLTYAQLDLASDKLARRLVALGAKPNTLIAIVMERGWEQVVAALAIVKSGAAYLPIDVSLVPRGRIQELLMLGEVSITLTQPHLDLELDIRPMRSIELTLDTLRSYQHHDVELPTVEPHDLAYVIFTSGSTGVPKGVMIEHHAVVNTLDDINARFGITASDRTIALASLGFDLSVWDIFGLLSVGGAITMPPPDARVSPDRWQRFVETHAVTVWNSVPKVMELFVEHVAARTRRLPSSLRLVMLSGDWIPITLPGAIKAVAPHAHEPAVVSLGGATEVSIWSIYFPIEHVEPSWQSIPYGWSMSGQQVEVLDDRHQPREPWVIGEIYIGGCGLARGYWRKPELTANSFIQSKCDGQRRYRTGDLGRYLPDGSIEFLGRRDSQVKIRGYRVELGEIEARVRQHPKVKQCLAVVLTGDQANHNAPAASSAAAQIVLYAVAADDEELCQSDLNAFLSERLPGYMMPSAWVFLNEIPLSANGKVDRKQLPMPDNRQAAVAARDDLEQRILTIWQKVLGQRGFGVTDRFFDLGGDSLQLTRIAASIERELCVQFPVEWMYNRGLSTVTVESCARRLRDTSDQVSTASSLVSIQPHGTAAAFFAVHPVGGSVLCYGRLATLLGHDQPFFALQSQHSPAQPEAISIKAMAADYLEQVRAQQPYGPYYLGGWSLGGTIAFEMAHQLELAGEEVALLALIDSWAPAGAHPQLDAGCLLKWFCRDLCSLARKSPDSLLAELQHDAAASVQTAIALLREHGVVSDDLNDAAVQAMFRRYSRNARAGAIYQPGMFAGRALLIRAAHRPGAEFSRHPALRNPQLYDPAHGWATHITGDLQLSEAPGDHYGVLGQEGVQTTAALLSAALQAAAVPSVDGVRRKGVRALPARLRARTA